ncbi:hypothetical protein [Desulfosporosinus youngiae]|uniref:Uncharacterized protein n=1 Tax=Desulfosporosinus youngiae DSM 17734 TaxID=768710 RepID=H5Y2G5_9FIRM|nr:hypothetical protein [Desulfosporosinus youngiae]EHQ88656.1 hypothetical protein DesyoDRAFT_1508 [Desulfosporosinus youngiae DSM 17734]
MNKSSKYFLLVMALCALLISILPGAALANSAEPPSLVILINNPPDDLSIVMVSNDNKPEASVRRAAWEGYYVFYSRDMQAGDNYRFKVPAEGNSFECSLDTPLAGYNNVFTLDLGEQKLTLGQYPFRRGILVSIRVVLTLMIEGAVFWLFGFRSGRSWLIFLAVNLVTQGALNIWLNYGGSLLPSYLLINLIVGEFFVFAAELIGLAYLIREHSPCRVRIYVVAANVLSLIAGGYIISVLPV